MVLHLEKRWRYKKKDRRPFHEEVFPLIEQNVSIFFRTLRSHLYFHLLFIAALSFEFLSFVIFYPLFPESILLASFFSLFVFTLFFYGTAFYYLGEKKEEQWMQILDSFLLQCQEFIPFDWEDIEYHTCLSFGLRKFSEEIEAKKRQLFPKWMTLFSLDNESVQKGFVSDYHRMKELLLQSVVQEHLEMVKISPINLEVHASLANSYILLSALYKQEQDERPHKIMERKFKEVLHSAIEEYGILKEYAPNDPWVHMQLAYCFRDLKDRKKEIREYEEIVALRPGDLDSLFHLGSLYFMEGKNVSGLNIYEKLKGLDPQKSEELMSYYGRKNIG